MKNSSSCNYYKFPLIFYRIYNVVDVNANIYLTEWRNRVEGNRRRASGKSVSKRSPDRGDAKFRASPVTKWYVHLFYRASPRGSIPSRMIDASPVPCRWNQKSLIRGRCKTIVSTPGRRCGRSAFLQLASVSSSNFSLFFHTHYLFIYFFLNRYPKGYPFLVIIRVVIKKFYYSKGLCFKDQRLLHNRNMEYLYPYFNDTCSKRFWRRRPCNFILRSESCYPAPFLEKHKQVGTSVERMDYYLGRWLEPWSNHDFTHRWSKRTGWTRNSVAGVNDLFEPGRYMG